MPNTPRDEFYKSQAQDAKEYLSKQNAKTVRSLAAVRIDEYFALLEKYDNLCNALRHIQEVTAD